MDIRIPIFILVLFRYLLLQNSPDQYLAKTKLIRFTCLLLILESGLQHICVGSDMSGYHHGFVGSIGNSWSHVLSRLFVNAEDFRDPGFSIVRKLFQDIIPSWQLWLLSLSTLFFVGLGKLWNKYIETMEGVLFATTLFLALFNIVVLSAQRQQITMALSMYMIPFVEDKRWKIVIPTVLIGSLIHISFLFFLAFVPLSYLNKEKLNILFGVSILLIPIIAVSSHSIVAFLVSQLENEYYMGYVDGEGFGFAINYIVMCSLASIFLFFFRQYLLFAPKILTIASIMMTLSVPLIYLNGSMIRIGQYFTIYMMLSVPYIINRAFDKVVYWIFIIIICIFAIRLGFEYHFFWEDIPGYTVVPFGYDSRFS